MESLNQIIYDYGKEIEHGTISLAYRGLMNFIMKLRTHFTEQFPELKVAGSLYQGYMDVTFFSLSSPLLQSHQLKIAVVFVHEKVRFELWLTGRNTAIQSKYRKILRDHPLCKYSISPDEKGMTSILETVLVERPNFDKSTVLTRQIEAGLMKFLDEVEGWKLK